MTTLWELDQSLFRQIHLEWHRDWLDPIFWTISSTGLGWVQTLAILAALPWRSVWRRSPRKLRLEDWRPTVWPLLLAVVFSSLVNTAFLKKVISRDRPSNLPDAVPQESFFHNSFPSGHTATSFAIAFTLVFLTWRTPRAWMGGLALVWAVLVGLSRVYRGVHWPSDVLGGAMVGMGSAALVAILISRAELGGPPSRQSG